MEKSKVDSSVVFLVLDIILGVAIVCMVTLLCLLYTGKVSFSKEPEPYSSNKYYQMVTDVTGKDINFYVHNRKIYLNDSFDKPVGDIYKREDGCVYILYNDKEYDLDTEDKNLIEVEFDGK